MAITFPAGALTAVDQALVAFTEAALEHDLELARAARLHELLTAQQAALGTWIRPFVARWNATHERLANGAKGIDADHPACDEWARCRAEMEAEEVTLEVDPIPLSEFPELATMTLKARHTAVLHAAGLIEQSPTTGE